MHILNISWLKYSTGIERNIFQHGNLFEKKREKLCLEVGIFGNNKYISSNFIDNRNQLKTYFSKLFNRMFNRIMYLPLTMQIKK